MNRAILTLLVSSASLVAFLLMSPSADAITIVSRNISLLVSAPNPVQLDNTNHKVSWIEIQKNQPLEQLGCSCPACQKALSQMQGQIVF